jgi:hypothetical protein
MQMPVSIARRRLLLSLPVWPTVLTGCIDDGGPPRIDSFTASSTRVSPGASLSLLALFQDGAGVIDQGVGRVRSGVPIEVTPDGDTVYTLTVHNGSGEVTALVNVLAGFLRAWDFAVDTPETWGDPSAVITDGQLLVSSESDGDPESCGDDVQTSHDDTDEGWLAGTYGALRLTAVVTGAALVKVRYGELDVVVSVDASGQIDAELVIDLPEAGAPEATLNGVQIFPGRVVFTRTPGNRGAYITVLADYFCGGDGGVGTYIRVRTLRLESV